MKRSSLVKIDEHPSKKTKYLEPSISNDIITIIKDIENINLDNKDKPNNELIKFEPSKDELIKFEPSNNGIINYKPSNADVLYMNFILSLKYTHVENMQEVENMQDDTHVFDIQKATHAKEDKDYNISKHILVDEAEYDLLLDNFYISDLSDSDSNDSVEIIL